jgi:hypothetical protein
MTNILYIFSSPICATCSTQLHTAQFYNRNDAIMTIRYEDPNFEIFINLMLLPLSYIKIFFSSLFSNIDRVFMLTVLTQLTLWKMN